MVQSSTGDFDNQHGPHNSNSFHFSNYTHIHNTCCSSIIATQNPKNEYIFCTFLAITAVCRSGGRGPTCPFKTICVLVFFSSRLALELGRNDGLPLLRVQTVTFSAGDLRLCIGMKCAFHCFFFFRDRSKFRVGTF